MGSVTPVTREATKGGGVAHAHAPNGWTDCRRRAVCCVLCAVVRSAPCDDVLCGVVSRGAGQASKRGGERGNSAVCLVACAACALLIV